MQGRRKLVVNERECNKQRFGEQHDYRQDIWVCWCIYIFNWTPSAKAPRCPPWHNHRGECRPGDTGGTQSPLISNCCYTCNVHDNRSWFLVRNWWQTSVTLSYPRHSRANRQPKNKRTSCFALLPWCSFSSHYHQVWLLGFQCIVVELLPDK